MSRTAGPEYAASSAKRVRIRTHLLDLIEESPAGSAIPSERELCRQLTVSRPTLRSVVDELVRDGVLVRHHGKGVFVARAKIAQHLMQMGPAGRQLPATVDGSWASRILSFDVMAAGARVGRRLLLAPHDSVVRIHRLRLVDGEPVCVETIHLPRILVPDLQSQDLETASLYATLRERFDVSVTRAVQIIEPTVADEDEAELLGIPVHSPALLFERTTEDAEGRTVEFTHSIYRGDRYRIVSTLELGSATPPGHKGMLVGQWSANASAQPFQLDVKLAPDPEWTGTPPTPR